MGDKLKWDNKRKQKELQETKYFLSIMAAGSVDKDQ